MSALRRALGPECSVPLAARVVRAYSQYGREWHKPLLAAGWTCARVTQGYCQDDNDPYGYVVWTSPRGRVTHASFDCCGEYLPEAANPNRVDGTTWKTRLRRLGAALSDAAQRTIWAAEDATREARLVPTRLGRGIADAVEAAQLCAEFTEADRAGDRVRRRQIARSLIRIVREPWQTFEPDADVAFAREAVRAVTS